MRTAFLLIVAMVVVAAVSYSGIALLNGKYSATPIVNLIGPGDRPSVCAKRSEPYFESNKKILREISGLIIKSDWFTQLWVTDSEDFWKMELIDDEADVYDNVEPTKDDIETFLPLFNQLDIRDFNSPVLFLNPTKPLPQFKLRLPAGCQFLIGLSSALMQAAQRETVQPRLQLHMCIGQTALLTFQPVQSHYLNLKARCSAKFN